MALFYGGNFSKKMKMFQSIQFHIKRTRQFGFRSLLFYIRFKLSGSPREGIQLKGVRHPLSISNTGPDLTTLFQIFFAEEYKIPFDTEVNVIIDCGANVGLSAIYYANKYPNAMILALEPDANNFQYLIKNTTHYPNIRCLNKAVWSHQKSIQLIDIGTGNWSLQSREADQNMPNAIEALGISDLVEQYEIKGIDILKIDIEGAEKQLFSVNYNHWLRMTKVIAIELHPNIDEKIPETFNNAIQDFPCKKYFQGENLICHFNTPHT